MEFPPSSLYRRRESGWGGVPTYLALRSTLMAPLRVVAPILGGFIADYTGYNTVFLISIVMTAVGLMMLFKFQEPRNRTFG